MILCQWDDIVIAALITFYSRWQLQNLPNLFHNLIIRTIKLYFLISAASCVDWKISRCVLFLKFNYKYSLWIVKRSFFQSPKYIKINKILLHKRHGSKHRRHSWPFFWNEYVCNPLFPEMCVLWTGYECMRWRNHKKQLEVPLT